MKLEHLLVATDFGESSEGAESFAAELAEKLGAKITLLHVWSVPSPAYAQALSWPVAELEDAARRALDRARARMQARGNNEVDAVLVDGEAWERIAALAKELAVDLIVMGTHGRRGVERFLLGSVAEKVIRVAPAAVITVNHDAR